MVGIRDINEYLDAKTVILFVLAVAALVFTIIFINQWVALRETEALINVESLANSYYQSSITALTTRQRELDEEGKAEEEALLKKIPSIPDEAGLIEIIDQLGAETASDVSDIAFETRTLRENIVEMPVTISLVTDYYAFINFLEGLRDCGRFIQPSSFDISTDTELGGVLSITLHANAYAFSGAVTEE